MDVRRLAATVAVGLLAVPALADAASHPAATALRIGDHPAFVRVTVDFAGGAPRANEIQFAGITRYDAAVIVFHATAHRLKRSAYGVTARLAPGPSHVTVALSFRAGRMKYLSYADVTGNRLAIDLWKSASPARAAEIRRGAGGCLALTSWRVHSGGVTAKGTERGIFEHTFRVVVRGADGKVLGRRASVHGRGAWSTTVPYRASHRQTGTLEAVAFSSKDGALTCIAQVRVSLPAS